MTEAINTQATAANALENIKTKKHAAHLLTLAKVRADKQLAEFNATEEHIRVLEGLVETLPESTPTTKGPKVVCQVGDVVNFNYGREDRRTVKTGVVKAIKLTDGVVAQYLVVEGEGFDEAQYRIFPGQVVGNEPDADDQPEDLFGAVGTVNEADKAEERDPFFAN